MTLQTFTLGTFAQGAAGGATAFESIATATGTGSNTTITFNSIPSGFQHLQIRGLYREANSSSTSQNITLRFNGDSGANYARHNLYGDGASASGGGSNNENQIGIIKIGPGNTATANVYGAFIFDILDFASTSKAKTFRAFYGCNMNNTDTEYRVYTASGLWTSTSAITSLEFTSSSASGFATGTQFALYGIKGA